MAITNFFSFDSLIPKLSSIWKWMKMTEKLIQENLAENYGTIKYIRVL